MSGARKDDKERAQHLQELFQPISKDFGGIDSLALVEVLELVEMTQDTLDDVWKQTEYEPSFPESRMKHFLDIIGTVFSHLYAMFYLYKNPTNL